jgi:hypothetical protein
LKRTSRCVKVSIYMECMQAKEPAMTISRKQQICLEETPLLPLHIPLCTPSLSVRRG